MWKILILGLMSMVNAMAENYENIVFISPPSSTTPRPLVVYKYHRPALFVQDDPHLHLHDKEENEDETVDQNFGPKLNKFLNAFLFPQSLKSGGRESGGKQNGDNVVSDKPPHRRPLLKPKPTATFRHSTKVLSPKVAAAVAAAAVAAAASSKPTTIETTPKYTPTFSTFVAPIRKTEPIDDSEVVDTQIVFKNYEQLFLSPRQPPTTMAAMERFCNKVCR